MMSPASAFSRISRVDAMFSDSRSSVVNSSSVGNVDSAQRRRHVHRQHQQQHAQADVDRDQGIEHAASGSGSTISEMTATASAASRMSCACPMRKVAAISWPKGPRGAGRSTEVGALAMARTGRPAAMPARCCRDPGRHPGARRRSAPGADRVELGIETRVDDTVRRLDDAGAGAAAHRRRAPR